MRLVGQVKCSSEGHGRLPHIDRFYFHLSVLLPLSYDFVIAGFIYRLWE